MKNMTILFILFSYITFWSCDDYNNAEDKMLQLTEVSIQVEFQNGISAPNTKVFLKNNGTGTTISKITDENGILVISDFLPGFYEINAVKSLTKDEYNSLFNQNINEEEIIFNGTIGSTKYDKTNNKIKLKLFTGKKSALIFKQIYYAGSDPVNGASVRDQFLEIYNNSDSIISLENVGFAQIVGRRSTDVQPFTLSNGQFDWSQGIGQEPNIGDKANTDFVYAITVLRIDESPKLKPGDTFVIASTAINHKAPFTNNEGEEETINNPDLTVDLSNADAEAYLGDWWLENNQEPYFLDIQNPNVPDLIIDYFGFGRDLLLDPYGRDGFVLFRANDEEVKAWKKIYEPGQPDNGLYVRIPKTHILDAVDLTIDKSSGKIPRKMPIDLDASQSFVEEGAYSSHSVIRKTKKSVNGRIILQDSNSSLYDFVSKKAEPRQFQ